MYFLVKPLIRPQHTMPLILALLTFMDLLFQEVLPPLVRNLVGSVHHNSSKFSSLVSPWSKCLESWKHKNKPKETFCLLSRSVKSSYHKNSFEDGRDRTSHYCLNEKRPTASSSVSMPHLGLALDPLLVTQHFSIIWSSPGLNPAVSVSLSLVAWLFLA